MKDKLLQQQVYWFPVVVGLLIILSWHFAFRPTYVLWKEHQHLSKAAQQNYFQNSQTDYDGRNIKAIKGLLSRYSADSLGLRDKIVMVMSRPDIGVKIIRFPPPQIKDNGRIGEQQIKLEGDFHSLLKALHLLENAQGTGLVRSTQFRLEKGSSWSADKSHLTLSIGLTFMVSR